MKSKKSKKPNKPKKEKIIINPKDELFKIDLSFDEALKEMLNTPKKENDKK